MIPVSDLPLHMENDLGSGQGGRYGGHRALSPFTFSDYGRMTVLSVSSLFTQGEGEVVRHKKHGDGVDDDKVDSGGRDSGGWAMEG